MSSQPRQSLLITGASGLLGRCVTKRALAWPGIGEVFAGYGRAPERVFGGQPVALDLASSETASLEDAIRKLAPAAVIHAAAINPGGDEAAMGRVNAEGSRRVARATAACGARLVHVSTDVVHDGFAAPYADDAPANPQHEYGRSKAEAERRVLEACRDAVVVRTSLIYGLSTMDRGTRGFAERLASGEPVRLFEDVLRQPVWVQTLADALLELAFVARDVTGRLNVAGDEVWSRDAFGRRMLAWWDVPRRDAVETIRAADLPNPPPRDLRLDVRRAHSRLATPLHGVASVLQNAGPDLRATRDDDRACD